MDPSRADLKARTTSMWQYVDVEYVDVEYVDVVRTFRSAVIAGLKVC